MTVNATANYWLIRSSIPAARSAGGSRRLPLARRRAGKSYWGGYVASKAALEALVMAYAAETRRTALRVNLIDPHHAHASARQRLSGRGCSKLPKPTTVTDAFVALAETACSDHGQLIAAARGHFDGTDTS